MKLSRIRIEQVRKFRRPFELAGFDAGLNLFTGPNEAGKSTVVRAIRAAFFERYRSLTVEDLIPHGDSAASPTIEIDFETGAEQYRLSKTFFQRKRFNLSIGSRELDGEDAESHLAELLGFAFPGRGPSKPEHGGIPGLLWIEQGAGHDIKPAVGHATVHLQKALSKSVSEVASTHGDDVARRIRAERDLLVTQAGKARGVYADAIVQHEALAAEVAALDEKILTYRSCVDQLGNLRAVDEASQVSKPWEAFQLQLDEAKLQLVQAQGLAARLQTAREDWRRHDEHVKLIQHQLKGFDEQELALVGRERDFKAAETRVHNAGLAQQRWASEKQTAVAAYDTATRDVAAAQAAEWRSELGRRRSEAAKLAESLTHTVSLARTEEEQLNALRKRVTDNEIAADVVTTLRELQTRLRELRIRQDIASTRIQFELRTLGVTLDGQPLQGEGERLVATAAELDIPNVGRIIIVPGSNDLAQNIRDEAESQAEFDALALRAGVKTLEEAEAREVRFMQALADRKLPERALKLLAPQGIATLQATLADHQTHLKEAETAIANLPATVEIARPLTEAFAEQQATRSHLDSVELEANRADTEAASALEQRKTAHGERQKLKDFLRSEDHQLTQHRAAQALVDARALQVAQDDAVKVLEDEVTAVRPDILSQDVLRLERTVAQSVRTAADRKSQIALLRGSLEALGAQGQEESRADLAVRVQAAERRRKELTLRANALLLVNELLEGKQREATQRLQAPLQSRVHHYLQLLFPGASMDIAEDLSPGLLTRPGSAAMAAFETLSFGAREQMGLISRLAYADLLKAAGRPTLLILDDALVHSDDERLGQMKRVLFDAAQRHQVLLFTCHPKLWMDLGAEARSICALT